MYYKITVEAYKKDGGYYSSIYEQYFYRVDVARLVKELNSAYYIEVAKPEKEEGEK